MKKQLTPYQAELRAYEYYVHMLKALENFVTKEYWQNNKNLCLPIIGQSLKDQIFLSDYSEHRLRVLAGSNPSSTTDYSVVKFYGKATKLAYQIQNEYVVKYVENAWRKFEYGRQSNWLNEIGTTGGIDSKPEVWPLLQVMLESLNPTEKVIWGISGAKGWFNEGNVWKPIYGKTIVEIKAGQNTNQVDETKPSYLIEIDKPVEEEIRKNICRRSKTSFKFNINQ